MQKNLRAPPDLGVTFAPTAVRLDPMRTSKRKLKKMQTVISRGPGRSELFVWMVDHHAALVAKGTRGRMPWKELCVDFAADGLTDGNGKPPTELRASRTWKLACEEVQRLAAIQPAAGGHRSRPAGSYRPPAAAISEPASRRAGISSVPALAARSREPAAAAKPFGPDPTIEEQIAEVRRQFAANDRKRFGSM